jgi:hypothetical protein
MFTLCLSCLVCLDIHLFRAQCPGKYYWGYRTDGHTDITLPRQIFLRVQNWWPYRYHTSQADITEGTEVMDIQISHCPGRYYWGYRTYRHTDITLPRQLLLRVQNWSPHRYHTAQADITEATELMAIQTSHCPGRYYWGHRTDRHTDITLPRQILLREQNWSPHRYLTAQSYTTEGTELMVTQISHCPGRYYWRTKLIAIQISHCSVIYLPFIW